MKKAMISQPIKHMMRNCFASLGEVLEFIDTVYCQ